MAGAVAAAVAVWLIARYGTGTQLRTPGFAPAQRPASLGVTFVMIASAAASVAARAAVTLIERTASHPRRAWIAAGLLALVVSLSAPLAGHGITAAQRLTLVCMHLAVAAVLIPVFTLTIAGQRHAESTPGAPDGAVLVSGRRQAS
jgi:cytochrome bd-type quinol oxidase subunit 2